MGNGNKEFWKLIGLSLSIPLTAIVVALGVTKGLNHYLNDNEINAPGYKSVSYATGLSGHVEYTRYSDGSQDVKIYPGLGHRLFDSELHQDLNGDGHVDKDKTKWCRMENE